jgi:ABC-type nitrate/sulfonate/bicarbonate transport system permease component
VRVILARLGVLAAGLLLWELAAGARDPLLYVPPSRALPALAGLLRLETYPSLPVHLWVTLWEILVAYGLAAGIGVMLGFALGARRMLGAVWEPILAALYAVPSVVWYPSLMLFFGLGPASKVAFGFLLGFFPIALSVLAGIRQANPHLLTVARSMGAGPVTRFRKVLLPAMAGTLVSGLRAGLALTVVGVIVGEILGSKAGLGNLITDAYGLLRTAEYVGLVVIVAVVVLVVDGGAASIERRAARWQG